MIKSEINVVLNPKDGFMIRETEKIMIEDIEYAYDPEKEYIKDGHDYCKACHEQEDGKVLEVFGKKMIFKISCK